MATAVTGFRHLSRPAKAPRTQLNKPSETALVVLGNPAASAYASSLIEIAQEYGVTQRMSSWVESADTRRADLIKVAQRLEQVLVGRLLRQGREVYADASELAVYSTQSAAQWDALPTTEEVSAYSHTHSRRSQETHLCASLYS